MSSLFSLVSVMALALSLVPASYGQAPQQKTTPKTVVAVSVKGIINSGVLEYLKRAEATAAEQKAEVLLVTLNTPGGLLNVTRQILEVFGSARIPVVLYVSPAGASATSAGALIAQGAHIIAAAPGTNIGAAHPVSGQGEDVKGDMKDKVVNDTVAMAKSMARLRGHNEKWIEDAIRNSVSATAEEALRAKAINLIATDQNTLLQQLEGLVVTLPSGPVTLSTKNVRVVELGMTTAETVLHFLGDPNVTYLLMAAGGLGLYVEFTSPGALFPGIAGGLCLLLAFISMQVLPVSTGAIALLLAGVGLLIAEVFVTSFGLLAVAGVTSTVLGALFLLDPSTGDLAVSRSLIFSITSALVLFMGGLGWFLYKTRSAGYKGLDHMEGFVGEVETVDAVGRNGKMQLRGETWDYQCVGDGVVLPKDRVKVVSRDGFLLKVTKE